MSFTKYCSTNKSGRTIAPNLPMNRRAASDDQLVRGVPKRQDIFDQAPSAEMEPPTQSKGDGPVILDIGDQCKTPSLYDNKHLDQIHPDQKNSEPVVPEEVVKDGHYFYNIVTKEQCRLMQMVAKVEGFTIESGSEHRYSEEVLEKMRIFSGSAKLLSTSKMKQFVDLCQKNMNPVPDDPFSVTIDDLEGFWDMVYQQVPPLDVIYEDILKIQAGKKTTAQRGCAQQKPGPKGRHAKFTGNRF